jgi:serine/threonine protein kinase
LRKLRAICGHHTTLPSSHIISGDLTKIGESPTAFGGFADVWQGDQGGKRVCIKVLRIALNDTGGLRKVRIRRRRIALFADGLSWVLQSFFKEAVVWKRLRHPNIVPFLGVTIKPLQFVSEWMPNGTLTHYVTKNPSVNRIALVSPSSSPSHRINTNALLSCWMWRKVSTTSTLATRYTGT